MRKLVRRSRIDGDVAAPPSKSVMVRLLAAGLLAGPDETTIENPSFCGDATSAMRVVQAMGGTVHATPDRVVVTGGIAPRERVLDCGESGLCLRMFTAIAALTSDEITLTGNDALLRRPATAVEAPSEMLGATCRTTAGHPPVIVKGPFSGGEALVDGRLSSQFLSGLLLALPLIEANSTLTVRGLTSRPYVNLTLGLLSRFGVTVEHEDHHRFFVPGGQRIVVGEHRVEGDWSAAAFLLVLGALGGRIRVSGLDPDSVQADRRVLDVLEEANASVRRLPDGAEVSESDLRAFSFDLTHAPDLLPPLAALASRCEGTSTFHGVERLRTKECDRTDVVASELTSLGVRVEVDGDTMSIRGGPVTGGEVRAHGDHRIAMALATAGVTAGEPVGIEGTEHVVKSYPGFFEDLATVGGHVA
ncbi:MAG: 3-phosphoshikimate 1-carboxyvinyltransferase [Planctomycetota bacterium]